MKKLAYFYNFLLRKKVSRKKFITFSFAGLAALLSQNFMFKFALAKDGDSYGRPKNNIKGNHDLVAVLGEDPYQITVKAVEAMGGMERFVKKNGVVVIKPNIGWDRSQEQAGNTNPQVVAALIDMSFKAGAKRVNIFDITCNDPRRCYINSGIEQVAKEKGATIYITDDWNVVRARFNYKSPMEGWPVFKDALDCDTFINVPILKNHALTGLTLSMKNLMGVCGGNRGLMHNDIGPKLVDITDFISPDLTIIDAYRILVRNGPTGGSLEDVAYKKTVIAATDPTLADSYACKLVGVDPLSIPYIKVAADRKFGNYDVDRADILTLKI